MSPWGAAFFLVPITSKRWPAKLAVCLVRFFFCGSESKSYSDAKNGRDRGETENDGEGSRGRNEAQKKKHTKTTEWRCY